MNILFSFCTASPLFMCLSVLDSVDATGKLCWSSHFERHLNMIHSWLCDCPPLVLWKSLVPSHVLTKEKVHIWSCLSYSNSQWNSCWPLYFFLLSIHFCVISVWSRTKSTVLIPWQNGFWRLAEAKNEASAGDLLKLQRFVFADRVSLQQLWDSSTQRESFILQQGCPRLVLQHRIAHAVQCTAYTACTLYMLYMLYMLYCEEFIIVLKSPSAG